MENDLNPKPASPEYVQDMAKAMSLTDAQRLMLCDLGYLNEVMYGYLIRAVELAGYGPEDVSRVLGGLHEALDFITAAEAREIYRHPSEYQSPQEDPDAIRRAAEDIIFQSSCCCEAEAYCPGE